MREQLGNRSYRETPRQLFGCSEGFGTRSDFRLSIRRFWGKGERWKRKNLLSPSLLGRPDTQASLILERFTNTRLNFTRSYIRVFRFSGSSAEVELASFK